MRQVARPELIHEVMSCEARIETILKRIEQLRAQADVIAHHKAKLEGQMYGRKGGHLSVVA